MANVIIDDANLQNIANAIREKNGSTDTYKPSDMPQAILDISSATGIAPIDHTVTFLVEEEPYEIISVKNGNQINAPATEPTSENGVYQGWSVDGEKVEFPYTPISNTEINAVFSATRDEITCTTAGEVMFVGDYDNTDRTVTKTSDGIAVCGYCTRFANNSSYTTAYFACFVGETAESVQASNLKVSPTAIDYNGKTYYYSCAYNMNKSVDVKNAWLIGTYEDGYVNGSKFVCNETAITRLLDYYYCKIDE